MQIFYIPHGEGNGNPLQYSYLGNHMDRGAWRSSAHEVAKLDTTWQLSNNIVYAKQVLVTTILLRDLNFFNTVYLYTRKEKLTYIF